MDRPHPTKRASEAIPLERGLHHGMLLFSRLWFVIQDREEAGAELQEVDVAGDGVLAERKRKPVGSKVGKVVRGEVANLVTTLFTSVRNEADRVQSV
jgi:hypothetical protein